MSSPDRTTLLLTRSEVASLLDLPHCIAAVEAGLWSYAAGGAICPTALSVQGNEGTFHVKAAAVRGTRSWFAAKCNGNFPGNAATNGLPTIQGLVLLCDADDGRPVAVFDAIELTMLRTAAATAIATKHLARPDARVATIIGCGLQGRMHLRALAELLPLQRAFVHDLVPGRAQELARVAGDELELAVEATNDVLVAIAASDVVVTCTTSTQPLFVASAVRRGTFVAGVGADNPHKQELDPALFARAKIVVDHLEQCATGGDLRHALAAGVVTRDAVHAELADLVVGKRPGRIAYDEVILFDSTGFAIQDVAAAVAIYERAIAGEAGLRLAFGT